MKFEEKELLGKFYSKLKATQNMNKNQKSLFKKILIHSRKTTTTKGVINSSIHRTEINDDLRKVLEKKKLIQMQTEKHGYYILSAKGLWEYEKSRGLISLDSLLNDVNESFFSPNKVSLKPHDKVLLGTLIGCRFFSYDCSLEIDKKMNTLTNKNVSDILSEVGKFLSEVNILEKTSQTFESKSDPSHYVVARVSELKFATNHIYSDSDRRYYLDLIRKNNDIDIEKLKFLFKVLFPNGFNDAKSIVCSREYFEIFHQKRYSISANKEFLDTATTEVILETFDQIFL